MSRSLNWMLCGFVFVLVSRAAIAEDALGGFPPDDTPPLPQPAATSEPLSVLVYPVADLVVEPEPLDVAARAMAVENSPLPAAAPAQHQSPRQRTLENLSTLSMLMQSVVSPDSWELTGGPGRIAVSETSSSLIVRQSDAVHREIADLLQQLRRAIELEVEVSCRVVLPRDEEPDSAAALDELAEARTGPLDAAAATAWVESCRTNCRVLPLQRVRLQNGRTAQLGDTSVTAVVAADGRSVGVHLSSPALAGEPADHRFYCRLEDGRALLLPMNWTGEAKQVLLSVTIIPSVVVEQPLLPIPGSGELLPVTPADAVAVDPLTATPVTR